MYIQYNNLHELSITLAADETARQSMMAAACTLLDRQIYGCTSSNGQLQARMQSLRKSVCYIASSPEATSGVAGIIYGRQMGEAGYGIVHGLAVAEDFKRKGIGRTLISLLGAEFAAEGTVQMGAYVRLNPGTYDFYRSCGWTPESEIMGDMVRMARSTDAV